MTQTTQPIRVGAIFPQTEMRTNPQDIAKYATTIETMGFQHILVFDHVLGGSVEAYPHLKSRYNSASLFHEPLVLFGYLAAITSHLELVSGVIILPQRQTALVAKQASEIDILSSGRLRMGVGIGWDEIQFHAMNEQFSNRASRLEEQITLLRQLWRDDVIDFEGTYHTVKHAGINPLPTHRSIPIWIGASAEPAVRRAARIADGFISTALMGDELNNILRWIRDELDRNNRTPKEFGIEGRISLASGTEDDWKREFTLWQEAGASHLAFNTKDGQLHSFDEHLQVLERALRAVEPLR